MNPTRRAFLKGTITTIASTTALTKALGKDVAVSVKRHSYLRGLGSGTFLHLSDRGEFVFFPHDSNKLPVMVLD